MRKIDKSLRLASDYFVWHAELEAVHPEYTSSSHKYYRDIVMNLFACQQGLCAYTEMRLCHPKHSAASEWHDGRYINQSFKFQGQLDHFDPNLKKQQGWLWDNFFMVHTDLNTKIKGSKVPDAHFKPDRPDYDPTTLMAYHLKSHRFITLNPDDAHNLEILGINEQWAIDERRRELSRYLTDIKLFGIEQPEIDCFRTAVAMIRESGDA